MPSFSLPADTPTDAPVAQQRPLVPIMMALFFAFGFCTVMVDTLIPKLKAMFSLTYAEVMLTQFCFFLAYFIVSTPAGWLITKIGYLRGVTVGLVVMAAGALLFLPAAQFGIYPAFLLALFILASGVTTVQVAANPLTASLGDPAKASSRLTLAQAFNSLATTVVPVLGAALILSHGLNTPPQGASKAALNAYRQTEAHIVQGPFIVIAIVLALLAALCWTVRRWAASPKPPGPGSYRRLLENKRLMLGAVAIFAYVGAEVSIGSALTNYLMLGSTIGAKAQVAGSMVSIYWGLAMVGRFIGSGVLRRVRPGLVLAICAIGAGILASTSGLSIGWLAAGTILCVGLFNSIMFPTIFTLAIEDLGEETPQASGLLCLAIVGGAVIPLATGFAADKLGVAHALFVPVICYIWIAIYGGLTISGALGSWRPRTSTLVEVVG